MIRSEASVCEGGGDEVGFGKKTTSWSSYVPATHPVYVATPKKDGWSFYFFFPFFRMDASCPIFTHFFRSIINFLILWRERERNGMRERNRERLQIRCDTPHDGVEVDLSQEVPNCQKGDCKLTFIWNPTDKMEIKNKIK